MRVLRHSLALVLWVVTCVAQAAEVSGVRFAEQNSHAGVALPLRGAGLLTYFFIKAYASALYLPADTPSGGWATDVPKCLQIAYLVGIDGKDFGPAGEKVLARMVSAERMRAIKPQLAKIDKAYVDIKKGDRYDLCYAPGTGTTLKYNGKALTTVPGADFAAIYFNIWLGSKPVDDGLRDRLLALRPK